MNKIKIKNLTEGDIIKLENDFWKILDLKHSHLGRGGANIQIKLKNIINNTTISKNFSPDENVELVEIEEKPIKFVYQKDNFYYFFDNQNKKYQLSKNTLGNKANFVKKDLEIKGLFLDDHLINIILPVKAKYLVTEAPPGLKGDSQKNNTKTVTIETGYQLSVPLFIDAGDYIIINTETGEYVERAK
jgi:elongation factor P